jgi:glycosyltransferase involved in cell wall biosynthesis
MRVSAVVRSKDEAGRLRLTLTSLARQTVPAEVIVVDDGSTDHTRGVLAEAAAWLPLRVVTHTTSRGRAGASQGAGGHQFRQPPAGPTASFVR